jgi:hypothetical protein
MLQREELLDPYRTPSIVRIVNSRRHVARVGGDKFGGETSLETSTKKSKTKITRITLRWIDDVRKTGQWNWLRVVANGDAGSREL